MPPLAYLSSDLEVLGRRDEWIASCMLFSDSSLQFENGIIRDGRLRRDLVARWDQTVYTTYSHSMHCSGPGCCNWQVRVTTGKSSDSESRCNLAMLACSRYVIIAGYCAMRITRYRRAESCSDRPHCEWLEYAPLHDDIRRASLALQVDSEG